MFHIAYFYLSKLNKLREQVGWVSFQYADSPHNVQVLVLEPLGSLWPLWQKKVQIDPTSEAAEQVTVPFSGAGGSDEHRTTW